MFRQALIDILNRLDRAKERKLIRSYALVGGFAVSAWGVARATGDIDLAVALGGSDPVQLATYLRAIYQPGDQDDPLSGVFRLELATEGAAAVPVQLIVLRPTWIEVVFRDIATVPVLDCSVPVVNWPALVLLKLYAGGPTDLQDARNILAVRQPNDTERRALAGQASVLGLAEEFKSLASSF